MRLRYAIIVLSGLLACGDMMKDRDEMVQLFKRFNRYMVLMWRLGLGRVINMAPERVGRIMVLVHIGRKSGQTYYTPVNYDRAGDRVYCMAGFGERTQWYQNIMATPVIEIWLPGERWLARATDVTQIPDRAKHLRAVLLSSGFAAETFEGIDPQTLSDDALEAMMDEKGYRLLRLEKQQTVTGRGGPGDLAWVWLVMGGLPLVFIAWRSLRRP